jgi:hypothetical protein
MPLISRTTVAVATSPSTSTAPAAGPWNAAALRDAALAAHTPVRNGEGYKSAQDVTSRSLSSLKSAYASWGRFEASKMMAVPVDDVTMRVVAFEYHSGKAMEAWLDAVPDDKILEVNVVTCVSGHDNLPSAKFAKDNVYVAEVRGPDGKVVRSPDFGPGVTRQEEFSSVSPKLTVDISRPGDYVVNCAPKGSAGAGGYVEARKLVIHVTGREPTIPA